MNILTSIINDPKVSQTKIYKSNTNVYYITSETFTCYKRLHAWKVSKYGVISGPYFPIFGLNTQRSESPERSESPYSVRIQENTDQK